MHTGRHIGEPRPSVSEPTGSGPLETLLVCTASATVPPPRQYRLRDSTVDSSVPSTRLYRLQVCTVSASVPPPRLYGLSVCTADSTVPPTRLYRRLVCTASAIVLPTHLYRLRDSTASATVSPPRLYRRLVCTHTTQSSHHTAWSSKSKATAASTNAKSVPGLTESSRVRSAPGLWSKFLCPSLAALPADRVLPHGPTDWARFQRRLRPFGKRQLRPGSRATTPVRRRKRNYSSWDDWWVRYDAYRAWLEWVIQKWFHRTGLDSKAAKGRGALGIVSKGAAATMHFPTVVVHYCMLFGY